MKIVLQKLPGRNLSTKASLDNIRGTIVLEDGTVVLASAGKLKIVDGSNLKKTLIKTFVHVKQCRVSRKGNKTYPEREVTHTIYEVDMFGVPMLFEQIDDEVCLTTFNNSTARNKTEGIDGTCFRRLTFTEVGSVATGDLDEVLKKELDLNKPKVTKSKKTILIKVKKLPVDIKITYK